MVERERGGGGETERGEEREGVIEKREREAKPVVRLGRSIRFFKVRIYNILQVPILTDSTPRTRVLGGNTL